MSGADDAPELDDVAARALASIILERTAEVIVDTPDAVETALRQLHDDTGLVWDVCAAILMATAWLCGAGAGLDPAAVFAAAQQLDPGNDGPAEVDDATNP